MREGPTFDEREPAPPRPQRPIDGLTDAQWAAKVRRSERNFRIVFGLVFGLFTAVVAIWHWLPQGEYLWPAALVVGGSMLLFAALFAGKRDEEAIEYAGWMMLPEWKVFERLPGWAVAAVWGATLGLGLALVLAIVLRWL